MKVLLATALAALAHGQFVDECSQYPDCQSCLNVQDEQTGKLTMRPNCGWCHFNIQYEDGTTGARCADVRDKPFKCRDLFDTYMCTAGYECNAASGGTCAKTKPGDGFQNITTCQEYYPDGCKAEQSFKCNTTSYQCIACEASETGCEKQDDCSKNCKSPPTPKPTPVPPTPPPSPGPTPPPPPPPLPANSFRCNHTTGECAQCTNPYEQTGCDRAETACLNCRAPFEAYTCNETSLTCYLDPRSTQRKATCEGLCTNSTPPLIANTVFRGFAAHVGFKQGEWDYKFDESNGVQIKDPAGEVSAGHVKQVGNQLVITVTSGKMTGQTMKAIQPFLNEGDETDTLAFGFGAEGSDAPARISDAFTGVGGMRAHVVHRCKKSNTPTGQVACNFDGVFGSSIAAAAVAAKPYSLRNGYDGAADECNAYTTCNKCIGATAGGIKCGWCMGGFVRYNDTTMPTTAQCAGYKDGQAKAFTCAPEFRTAGCEGFKCLFESSPPKCVEDPEGEAPTMESCQAGTQSSAPCKAIPMVKCNHDTKQCEACAAGSSEDCKYTQEQCEAVCAVDHAKCDFKNKQCVKCNFGDANCTMTLGACQAPGVCVDTTYGLCNPATGKCDSCDPNTQVGCVQKCSDTCTQKPTPPPTPPPSPPTPSPPTPPPSPPPKPDFYKCDWSLLACVKDSTGQSHQTLSECNSTCKSATFAKCNTTDYKCYDCDHNLDPKCSVLKANCDINCKPPPPTNETVVYRGIEISNSFVRGEWDFTFYPDKTVSFGFQDGNGGQAMWEATSGSTFEAGSSATQSIMLTVTKVNAGTSAPAGLPALKVGDKLSGIYEDKSGNYVVTDYKYLALSTPGGTTPADMDAGMSGLEFVLTKCHGKDTSQCDFSTAQVPEL